MASGNNRPLAVIYLHNEQRPLHHVMRLRAFAPVLALLAVSSAVATETSPAAVVKTFETYRELNKEFLSAVESGRSKSGKPYAEIRKAVEDYSEGPFKVALANGVTIVCRSGDTEVIRALFRVILATRHSASESLPSALGQSFMCQPALFSKEFRKLSQATRQVMYDTLEFGFHNAKHDHPLPGVDIGALDAQLRSIDPSHTN